MNVTQIVETTEQVIIERGSAVITLDCYLERINAENEDYDKLAQAGREIDTKERMTAAEFALFMAEGWIEQQVVAPIIDGEDVPPRLPTESEVKKRTKVLTERVKQIQKEVTALRAEALTNKCEKIVYLVKSWDVTQGEKDEPLSISVTNLKKFSPILIDQMVAQIEEAVFGPLAIP